MARISRNEIKINQAVIERCLDLPKSNVWISEAAFGLGHIKPYLCLLPAGARVLEVGSGSGILLSHIKLNYPELVVQGIEPIGSGFDSLNAYHESLKDMGAPIERCGYEDIKSSEKFDLIFLINVFEHLPDWIDFLGFVKSKLIKNGTCIILCPNYGFPYESHFRIPLILNKNITHRVFKNYIEKFEAKQDCKGLWDSLNFVRWSQVKKACRKIGIDCEFDGSVIRQMIDRLDYDNEFHKRQKVMGKIAKVIGKSGLLSLITQPFFNTINPYMKLEVRLDMKRDKIL
jgi:SAM-dependent methyltransferase